MAKISDAEKLREYVKQPPQAVDVEKLVLGAMLLESNAVNKVIDILQPEYFYDPKHQAIFEAMVSLFKSSEPIDAVSLFKELRKANKMEAAGGAAYISQLAQDVATTTNVEYHARVVVEKWILRELIKISIEIASSAYEGSKDVFDLLDEAESKIFEISEETFKESYVSMEKAVWEAIEYIEAIHNRDVASISVRSGFTELDELLGGFQKSDLIIVAARPSMGKTAFALSLARNAAIDYDVPIAIFSLEMSTIQLVTRLISAESRINAHSIRTGRFKAEDGSRISRVADKLSKAKIYIDDTPAQTVLEIRAKARRLKAEKGIGLIIVDYLQLMDAPTKKNESREREISMISRSLKSLAKELNIPVIALSQLNRAVEQRHDKRPMLSDLRESGSIEQDADVVIFLYRPEVYGIATDNEGNSLEGIAEVIVGKQRNGPVGSVKLRFIKDYARFENLDLFHSDEPDVGAIPDYGDNSFENEPDEDLPI
jgi:replicative DNA helicase